MLKSLKINNIAVIENAEPVFSNGLNVLTGETGAGKSIIIDSLNAILGERTSKNLIRNGSDRAVVVAVFDEVSPYCKDLFDEYGIEDESGEYILQRIIQSSGKNSCRINGMPVNTNILKEIGAVLVNIHGQHDSQLLLNSDNHCSYLDAFADNGELLNSYKSCFEEFKRVRKELNKNIEFENEKKDRIEILKFQINELENADINIGEIESLKEKLHLCENSEKIHRALNQVLENLSQDSSFSPLSTLFDAEKNLNKITNIFKEVGPTAERFTSVVYDLKSIAEEIESFRDNLSFNEIELNNIQNRLDFLYNLMRKYGNSEEKMLSFLSDAKEELSKIITNSEKRLELEAQLVELQDKLISSARKLSDSRINASKKLSGAICEILQFLNMEGVEFLVDIKQGNYNSLGTDRVEFLISANKGQKLMPLAKVASGGELSRVMLAIKSILADKDNVDTLIFDEIDTGISGRVAVKIAIQLKRVSKIRQVICITHLAQIAAIADNHMLISKETRENGTYTSVKTLEGDDRIGEVARIMSGTDITENLYNTAAELIEKASVVE